MALTRTKNGKNLTLAMLLLIANNLDYAIAGGGYGGGYGGYGNSGASASASASASANSFSTAGSWNAGGYGGAAGGDGGPALNADFGGNPFLTHHNTGGAVGGGVNGNPGGNRGLSLSVHKEYNLNGLKEGFNGIKEGIQGLVGGVLGGVQKIHTDVHGNGGGLISGLLNKHKGAPAGNNQAHLGGSFNGANAGAAANAFANANANVGGFYGPGGRPCQTGNCGSKPTQHIPTPFTNYFPPPNNGPHNYPGDHFQSGPNCYGADCYNGGKQEQPTYIQRIPPKPKVQQPTVAQPGPCSSENCNKIPQEHGVLQPLPPKPKEHNLIVNPVPCLSGACGGPAINHQPTPAYNSVPKHPPARHVPMTEDNKPIWPSFQTPNTDLNREINLIFNGGLGPGGNTAHGQTSECASGKCGGSTGNHVSFANADAAASSASYSESGYFSNGPHGQQPAVGGCGNGNCGNSCTTGQCGNAQNGFGGSYGSSSAYSSAYASASAHSSASSGSGGYGRK